MISASNGVEPAGIWKARQYIEQHCNEHLSLTEVAKLVHSNPTHFSEKFKQVTGMNFVEYIARARFGKACELLRSVDLRVSEIAFAVGFQSLSQFNRVFRKFSGKSPTQYRFGNGGFQGISNPDGEIRKNPKKCVVSISDF